MRTSKPISMFSDNTDEFLIHKLNQLIRQNEIEFWAFIEHQPEEYETKWHKHVFIIPKKTINVFTSQYRFEEFDLLNPDKPPLQCTGYHKFKFEEWYMYVLQYEKFFISRGHRDIKFKYHYVKNDIIVSDKDYFDKLINEANYKKIKNWNIETLCNAGRDTWNTAPLMHSDI